MPKLKLAEDIVSELIGLSTGETVTEADGLDKTYTIEYAGEWEDEGKYSSKVIIVKIDDKLYQFSATKSGSYYTDYYYSYETEGTEMEAYTKTITDYRAVK